MFRIRPEQHSDAEAIHALNEAAFGRSAEAELVNRLREEARPLVSLVADDGGAIVGHILFSPVDLSDQPDLMLMGLGPMAVKPERQGRGIGSELVLLGLDACQRLGCQAVFVLGHPTFYRRFGFRPASQFGITSECEDAGDAFMALEIERGILEGRSGTVRYDPVFSVTAEE
jgi:putative acetyltransferase